MVIRHEEALAAAEVLAFYCGERWNEKSGECQDCLFQYRRYDRPGCRLQLFLGFGGQELQEKTRKEVDERRKKLK